MTEESPVAKLSHRLLYEEAAEAIRKLIAERGLWESYLLPERELARLLGINRGTIRKGLDLLIDEGLIERRQGRGTWIQSKSRGRGRNGGARVAVASLWGRECEGYVGRIMSGLTAGAGSAGWSVSFFGGLGRPAGRESFMHALRRQELDGLVLFTIAERDLVEEILRQWNGPSVLVDHHFPDLPLTSVMDDSRDGARQVTEHLLTLGHRRIGYVDLASRHHNPWRIEGYRQALQGAGIGPDEALVTCCHISFEEGRAAGGKLLDRPDPPTAMLAFDDGIAWGIWRAAEDRGLVVGRDFAVAGYGDSTAGAGFPDELTSVRVDMHRLGEMAAAELDDLIAGKAQPGRLVLAPAELVIRKSSENARPRGAAAAKGDLP